MGDEVMQAGDRMHARPLAIAIGEQERRFWFGVAFAAAVHAALILAFMRSPPRQMGERSGRSDGISVVLVDEADLNSKNTFREDGAPSAAGPRREPAAPQAPAPKTPDSQQAKEPPSPEDAAVSVPQQPADQVKSGARAIEKEALEPSQSPGPPAKQTKADDTSKDVPKQPPPAPPKKTPPLQLTMPNLPVSPGDRGAAVMRPPGVTRSGENDDFGRGVIRALRKTMPAPYGQLGRVTVRLLLSANGNLVEVQLVRSAGNASLDQSVVFAVKQASFPFPPANATLVDRTFLVTYIYN